MAGDAVPTAIVDATLTLTVTDPVAAVVAGVVPLAGTETPAVAVTFVVLLVVRVTCAVPVESVDTTDALSDPLSALNVTGMPASKLPLESPTFAVIVDVPPLAGTVPGLALTPMLVAAAAPIAIFTTFAAATETPPEIAVIVAVPEIVPARNLTVTRPLMSVSASDG